DVDVPWWRVVNASGRIVAGDARLQAELLTAEGVVVRDGRVVAAGPRDRTPVDADRVVDLRGAFLTAGLWNCHVHFSGPPWAEAKARPAAALAGPLRAMLNRHGFTSVVDTGSMLENTVALRERIRRGDLAGPAIFTAGEPLYPRGGVPIYLKGFFAELGIAPPEVGTPEEAAAAVRRRAEGGADLIKLFTGSPVGRGRAEHMPLEVVNAAVAEAQRLGKPVFAHPQDEEGVRRAVDGGVDVLAHTAPGAGPLPPELLARMRQARVAVVPTLTLFHRGVMQEGTPEADALALQARGVEQLRGLVAAGVEVLFGTDVGYMSYAETADELRLMASAGMGFDRLLAALTAGPARRFGREGRVGRVAPGYDADLTAFAADPRADARAFAAPRLSLRAGRPLYDAAPAPAPARPR
ncbi:MAG TPA: amidohydrolase family protein, partial [Polyangiaceae bacterium]|nr:amidohydrolase family protein [Polyangiaceae bacterium]